MKKPQPGPTGDYPHGKLNEDDEGGINVALSNRMAPDGTRMVQFDFGKPVAWLSLPREQAVAFAALILKHAGVAIEIGVIGGEEGGTSSATHRPEQGPGSDEDTRRG